MSRNGFDAENRAPLLSVHSISPNTLTKLVKRLRALTLTLLPVEVDPESINDPTSRVITPQVITAFTAAAGDFAEALPYCLLRARAEFMWDANHDPADYGENYGRAVACEVLARRIVHQAPKEKLTSIMSTRYKHVLADGEESNMSSALEMAIDTRCKIFLSSNEAQAVVNSLWNGELIQKNNHHHEIDYVPYHEMRENTFWAHLNASRLSVPRYQNIFRVIVWLFFLGAYSQAVREPLDRLDQHHSSLDFWEVILYTMSLSFFIEDVFKLCKLRRFATWRALGFWDVISFITASLLICAFILRIAGQAQADPANNLRLRSFQVLSFVSPFIWMRLVTVFDGYKYIGTMQICVARMLQESGIFFALLSVLGLGFAQGLYALDSADGEAEHASSVLNVLVQALLQSPNYDSPAGLTLYYFWNLVTSIILLNVLISLFSSAYSDVVDNAEAEYLAFFASKTVKMIRAPDSYVYPAPFNIIEAFFIAPFESAMKPESYAKLNRYVMATIFFLPLSIIALYESTIHTTTKHSWMKNWLTGNDEGEADVLENQDPVVDDEDGGLKIISRAPFAELIKVFPNTEQSSEATILKEIKELKMQLDAVMAKLGA